MPDVTKDEIGSAVCVVGRTGRIVRGPQASGTPTRVDIPLRCPPGSNIVGLYHTHPKGVARPSHIDVAAARQSGLNTLCVQAVPGELRCFTLRQPLRRPVARRP